MKRILLLLSILLFAGCEERVVVIPLPPPKPQVPPAGLPVELRQDNWLGKKKQGSCVYASTIMVMREHNVLDVADKIRQKYGDGSWETKLNKELQNELKFKIAYTREGDPKFLDWCSSQNKGAALWWKESHCCYFAGWVMHKGKKYAVIIDNNHTEEYELTEAERFVRLWRSYGGYAVTVVGRTLPDGTYVNCDPINPVPWASYRIERR